MFNQGTASRIFFGKTKALAVWKEALSDEELAELTYPTPTDPTFSLDFDTIAEQFTFARGSEATYVDAQGLIQSTNELGEELITNGDFSNGSTDWILSGLATIGNGVASFVDDGTNTNTAVTQNNVTSINKTYKVTFDIVRYVLGGVQLRLGNATAVTNELLQGVGSYTMYINSGSIAGNDNFQIKRWGGAPNFDFDIDNVSVKEVISATNTPRLDYSTGAEAFLLEPQSTNLITQSELFSDASWANTYTLIPSVVSPSGELNAFEIIVGTTNGNLRTIVSVLSNTKYVFSFYAKRGTASEMKYRVFDFTNSTDIVPKTSYYSQTNTDSWVRIEVPFTTGAATTSVGCYIDSDSQGNGDFYAWGAQVEQQSYATSYIPTSGTTVTRNQETCINATPEINSEEGVLYAEISALADDLSFRTISLSDGTTSNRCTLRYGGFSGGINALVSSNSGNVFDSGYALASITGFNKIALSYKLNSFSLWVNGTKVATDTSGNVPIGLNTLQFTSGSGTLPFFGNTKDLQVYTKALSDAELIKLTT